MSERLDIFGASAFPDSPTAYPDLMVPDDAGIYASGVDPSLLAPASKDAKTLTTATSDDLR